MWQDVKMLNTITAILLGLVLSTLLMAALWRAAHHPMFTLKTIQIEGIEKNELRHIDALVVRNALASRIKGNFFTVHLSAVKQAFESVPWVRRAVIRRAWPNKLLVTIEEHHPLGTWGEDGRLLSVKGDVFTVNVAEAEEEGDLLTFSGPEGSEKEIVARLSILRDAFSRIHLTPDAVYLSNRYAWSVKLNNGMTVQLGREETKTTLKERLDRLVRVYPQLLARVRDRIDSMDVRYPNGLALSAGGIGSVGDQQKMSEKK